MKNHKYLLLLFFTLFLSFNHLKNNPFLTSRMKSEIQPYQLPEYHLMMSAMDEIFMKKRVTVSDESLIEAGFSILFSQPRSKIRVVRHPRLPGYLVKLTLDNNTHIKRLRPDWEWLTNRCVGVKKVSAIIKKNKLKNIVVPDKWLYVLPEHPAPPADLNRKILVLLTEEMPLVDKATNKRKWVEEMTKDHLRDLFAVMSYGGASSWRPDNVWFMKDGRLALIDTEYPGRQAHYKGVKKYLSKDNQIFWDKLIKRHKKKS